VLVAWLRGWREFGEYPLLDRVCGGMREWRDSVNSLIMQHRLMSTDEHSITQPIGTRGKAASANDANLGSFSMSHIGRMLPHNQYLPSLRQARVWLKTSKCVDSMWSTSKQEFQGDFKNTVCNAIIQKQTDCKAMASD